MSFKCFFIYGSMPDGINDTTIILMLEVKSPESNKYLWPISLCNVVDKVISHVDRPSPLLDCMISTTQSAFIPHRLIFDSALITFECMRSLSIK